MMKKDAVLSDDGLYRYILSRRWDAGRELGFIMLNPSTADAEVDDPTIRRCIGFAERWGYGGIAVANLFALRSTNPAALKAAPDPVGPINEEWISALVRESDLCIAAWGAHAFAGARAKKVSERFGDQLSCLGVTKAGHPKHPLYLRADTQPVKFEPRGTP